MAGHVPQAIVLALGAGALGGPDALRLMLQFAGRSPAVDLAICCVVISLLTAPLFGTMLLARFVRKTRPGAGRAPATDLFAQVTATVAVGAVFLVTACLLAVPGGGGLGGAVSLPIQFAVKNSKVVTVLTICVVVISLVTALLLGTMHLARFVRKSRSAGGGGAAAPAATDLFVQVTAAVSVGAAFLVTACLLVVPGCVGSGAVRLPIDFAVKNSNVVTVLTICAGFAAGGFLPYAVHLRRFLRGAGSAGGPTPAGRCTTTIKFVAVAAVTLVASFVASGVFDAELLFPEFHWRRSVVTMPVGVAIAIVTAAGATLVVRCSRRVRSAAGAGGGAAARTC